MTAWQGAARLLCIRLDAMGDVLMTTPALRALAESSPKRRITLLTSPGSVEIARLVPQVDRVIGYAPPWMKATAPRRDPQEEYAMADRLRALNFDGAVIFTVYSQSPLPSALLCYLAGIPRVLAYCHENPYQLISDWVPDPEPRRERHEVQRQLDLVAAIGCETRDERLSLAVPERAQLRVRHRVEQAGLDLARPWVVVHPGATAPSRRYPPEGFAQAAAILVQRHGWQVVFTGNEAETALVESIRAVMGVPSISFAGRLRIEELAALVGIAPLLIVNNTGPAHIAAALQTPVVDLYALTNPQHTPWQVESRVLFHDVPCRSCYKSICPEGHQRCLHLVKPEEVVQAALEIARPAAHGPARGSLPQGWASGFSEQPL